jgi:dephospho-CoA kinase
MRADPFFVAVTGGIGAGKSEVTRRFEALGVAVIDADVIARELVAPGQPALQAIRQQFGGAVLAQDGKLDRRRMRELIFSDPGKKQLLEALLHPLIAMVMQQQARAASGPYVMLAIPLLAESHRYDWVDRVLLIDAPVELQRERIMRRDSITQSEADEVIAGQATRAQRIALADDVIINQSDLAELDEAVKRLHSRYLEIARRVRGSSDPSGECE